MKKIFFTTIVVLLLFPNQVLFSSDCYIEIPCRVTNQYPFLECPEEPKKIKTLETLKNKRVLFEVLNNINDSDRSFRNKNNQFIFLNCYSDYCHHSYNLPQLQATVDEYVYLSGQYKVIIITTENSSLGRQIIKIHGTWIFICSTENNFEQ